MIFFFFFLGPEFSLFSRVWAWWASKNQIRCNEPNKDKEGERCSSGLGAKIPIDNQICRVSAKAQLRH